MRKASGEAQDDREEKPSSSKQDLVLTLRQAGRFTLLRPFSSHTRTVETMVSILEINLYCRGRVWASPTPRRRPCQGS